MGFKVQRLNDIIYAESANGLIKVSYPYKDAEQVHALVDAARALCPENEASVPFGPTMTPADAVRTLSGAKTKKHRDAKKLTDSSGKEFKLADMVDQQVRASKTGRIPLANVINQIKHHYGGNENNAKNAIRIAAMKSERFSLTPDSIIARPAKGE